MVAPRHPTQRLGDLLMAKGYVTGPQLEQALAQQRVSRAFLGAILVHLGFVQPDRLLQTLSEQFGIPCESLTPEQVDWPAVESLPPAVFASLDGFPIRADAESVTVAIANPLEVWVLSAVEQVVGFRTVKPVLVLTEQLRRVQQAYRERSLRRITSQLDDHG